jgi:hypothetical protein
LAVKAHVVVIGVEPFRHFLRGHAVCGIVPMMGVTAVCLMCFALRAAGHREIGRERHRAAVPAIDLGNGAHHHGCVEYLIVERKIVRRDHGDAELFLSGPVCRAKACTGFDQRAFTGRTGPETFQREFQLATRADARRAEGGYRKC